MRILPWWVKMPLSLRVIRRLAGENVDLRDHNEYLAKTNDTLTQENNRLSRSEESLRLRVADLNRFAQEKRTQLDTTTTE